MLERVVVVGGGFGGLSVALRLEGMVAKEIEIILVDAKTHHTFTPWLYGVAASGLRERGEDVDAEFFCTAVLGFERLLRDRKSRIRFRQGVVASVDSTTKHIKFDSGETLGYDVLVLASGSKVNYFDTPGADEFTDAIQTAKGAVRLRDKIAKLMADESARRLIFIGAGPTGIETTAQIAAFIRRAEKRGKLLDPKRITLITASSTILSKLPERMRRYTTHALRDLWVEIEANAVVKEVRPGQVVFERGGELETLKGDLIVWCAGLKPDLSRLSFPLDKTGRLAINGFFQLKDNDSIFALGDIVSYVNPHTGETMPGAAWVAIEEAAVVARNIANFLVKKPLTEYRPMKRNPDIIALGHCRAVASLYGLYLWGIPAFIVRRLVDLRYFLMVMPVRKAFFKWLKATILFIRL